jgi:uncharacterized protein YdhG (YjbR/CyaY superfamily)
MTVIDDYFAKVEPPQRKELERIRRIVKDVVPEAVEVISYGMPGFKYKGRYLVSFAAFKGHMSLFPGSAPVESFKKELSGYKLSKGTIQFTLDKPLPDDIIKAIISKCVSVINEG